MFAVFVTVGAFDAVAVTSTSINPNPNGRRLAASIVCACSTERFPLADRLSNLKNPPLVEMVQFTPRASAWPIFVTWTVNPTPPFTPISSVVFGGIFYPR